VNPLAGEYLYVLVTARFDIKLYFGANSPTLDLHRRPYSVGSDRCSLTKTFFSTTSYLMTKLKTSRLIFLVN
jgi:hypothetical protein